MQWHTKPVVACSFGKNSMAVLHLVRQVVPDVVVLFNDTLVEYPDTYRFKRQITKDWGLKLIQTKPNKTFWWVVEQYGFPLFSRKGNKDATKNCCRYLKEYPIEKVLRQERFDLYFTGLTRHESRVREFAARKHGDYFYSRRLGYWRCHPIQDWTEDDVWAYHDYVGLPHNSFYDKPPVAGFEMRTGCWCCTIPLKYGKVEFLRRNYPHLWRKLLQKGLGRVISRMKLGEEISVGAVEHLLDSRPCFFDRV